MPDCTVSNSKFSSVTLNELAINESQRKDIVISSFNRAANKKTVINPNKLTKTCLEYVSKHLKFSDF